MIDIMYNVLKCLDASNLNPTKYIGNTETKKFPTIVIRLSFSGKRIRFNKNIITTVPTNKKSLGNITFAK